MKRAWAVPSEIRRIYGLIGCLLLLFWLVVFGALYTIEQRLLEEDRQDLEHLRNAVQLHTESLFQQVDISLRIMDQWLQANPKIDPLRDPAFNRLVDEFRQTSGQMIDPRMVSVDGQLHYLPTRQGIALADVRDRAYYREALRGSEPYLYIGDPVLSRVTGKWGIPVSRRLSRPVGGMQVVFGAIELDRLQAAHSRFVPAGGAVSIMHLGRGGMVLSRTPFDTRAVGKSVQGRPWFAQIESQPSGSFITDGALLDQHERQVSFARLEGYPLVVAVSQGVSESHESFYARRRIWWVVSALVSLLVLGVTWRLGRATAQRLKVEQQLGGSEARLRAITNNVPALISEVDADLRFLFVNPPYAQLMQRAEADILGHTCAELLSPDALAEIQPHLEAALRGERVSYQRRGGPAGGERWVQFSLVPRLEEAGAKPVGLYCVGLDVTELHQSEMTLRQREQLLRTVADRIPMRVSYVDREQRFRFVNQAYEAAYGQAYMAMLGRTLQEVLGETRFAEVEPYTLRALRGEMVQFESERVGHDGYHCYHASYVPQFDATTQAVMGYVSIISDVTNQKLEERRLHDLSRRDALTGLLNRSGFDERLRDAVKQTQASGQPLALMYVDIDYFKQINDTLGHQTGDLLLQGVAGRLLKTVRATDTVCRLGGDEFCVLLEGTPGQPFEEAAVTVARHIVAAMQPAFLLDQERVSITVSLGLALYSGSHSATGKELVKLADTLLYDVKADGRNGFRHAWLQPEP